MSKYDFDNLAKRDSSNSIKWELDDVLPMWVADQDFKVFPEIVDALSKRVADACYGYTDVSNDFRKAISSWWQKRNGVEVALDEIVYSSGVVASLSSLVRRLSRPGEKVAILTPVYNCFYSSILNQGRFVKEVSLKNIDNEFFIDYDLLDTSLADPLCTMLIFCNPHNPVGRLWEKDELKKVALLCKKHQVLLISDEIHSDFIKPGLHFNSMLSLSEEYNQLIVLSSISKTFNCAGLHASYAIVKDEKLRFQVFRGLNNDEVGEPNYFGQIALITAYTKGDEFVDELNAYIFNNKAYLETALNNSFIKVVKGDATYLVWLDFKALKMPSDEIEKILTTKYHLRLASGAHYGVDGEGYMRINLATSLENVKKSVSILKTFLKDLGYEKS